MFSFCTVMYHNVISTTLHRSLICLISHARFSLSAISLAKSHYDALGITPHATQSEIKAAYYKLSMKYHPDKNKDSGEAVTKFRDITEAYEVLGNFRLKKLYDKGLLHTAGSQYANVNEVEVDDDQTKFYKSRFHKDKPPPPTGRTPIYDFDAWSREHYGYTFSRQAAAKARRNEKRESARRLVLEIQSDRVMYGLLGFFICTWIFTYYVRESFDINNVEGEKKGKSNE